MHRCRASSAVCTHDRVQNRLNRQLIGHGCCDATLDSSVLVDELKRKTVVSFWPKEKFRVRIGHHGIGLGSGLGIGSEIGFAAGRPESRRHIKSTKP